MSGPKSGSWRVTPAASAAEARASWEHALKQLRHYRDCILRFRKQLEALQRRHPELKIHYEVDELTNIESLIETNSFDGQRVVEELNNRFEIYIRLRNEIERVEGLVLARANAMELVSKLVAQRVIAREAQEQALTERLALIRGQVEQMLASLDTRTAPEQKTLIEAVARNCLEAETEATASLYLTDLRVKLRRAAREMAAERKRQDERRDQDARTARRFLGRIDALNGSLHTALRQELEQVSSGETMLSEALRNDAEVAMAAAERTYAGDVLRETLERLGYDVQEGFDTLFDQGGETFFQHPSWGEHHVRVSVDTRRARLNFNVVRYGDAEQATDDQIGRDKEIEESWCDKVPALLSELEGRGVAIDLIKQQAPGAVAVQVIEDDRLKPNTARKRAAAKGKAEQVMRLSRS